METDKKAVAVLAAEEDQVSRRLLVWLNTWPEKPREIPLIDFGYLPADRPGLAMSPVQAAYVTRRYILGGHQAEYQFEVIYRVRPVGSDKRLQADEALNALGDWAAAGRPDIGEGKRVMRVEPATRAALAAAYEDGTEDHRILMKLTYEVIKNG